MKSVIVIVLLALTLLAVISIWQRWQVRPIQLDAVAEEEPLNSLPVDAPEKMKPAARGPMAPDIVSDTWLNSAPLATQDLRGHVVVLEFWTHG